MDGNRQVLELFKVHENISYTEAIKAHNLLQKFPSQTALWTLLLSPLII